ncbi:MAG: MBOAT family O-acyltransferase [Pseudomonadota bacterium]
MSIISIPFLLFVVATVALCQLSPTRFRRHVLLGASYFFYASHGLPYVVLLSAVTLAVYFAALALERDRVERDKLRLVGTLVGALVLLLAGFKLASAFTSLPVGSADDGVALRILVPLGLSYYLFKLIGYLLDVYWENLPAQQSLVSLALYASFFPQIVSGPIQRAGDFFEQTAQLDSLDPATVTSGLRRILFGLFKKLAIADRLAVLVDGVHEKTSICSSAELALGAYLFALQLYADFSGVTDIAIGVGQLFGVKGPENFDLPFFSRNLQEYWRRWHMSLTSWLADYLFTPLRMAFRGRGNVGLALAILINMVAVGVWHGAAWTYAAFGLFHGTCLVVSVFTLKRRDAYFRRHPALARVRAITAPLVTFHLVVFGLILFRASSFANAVEYIFRMLPWFGREGITATRLDYRLLQISPRGIIGIVTLGALAELVNWAARDPRWARRFLSAPRGYRWALYYAVILLTLAVSHLGEQKFIYAQF